jgi:hypothetical protein
MRTLVQKKVLLDMDWIWIAVDRRVKRFRFKGELSQDKNSAAPSQRFCNRKGHDRLLKGL